MKKNIITLKDLETLKNLSGSKFVSSLQDYVMTIKDLKCLLEMVSEKEIVVLGGDVLRLTDQVFTHTYENWFTKSVSGENWTDYAIRSIRETEEYAESFKDPSLYFDIVLKSKDDRSNH